MIDDSIIGVAEPKLGFFARLKDGLSRSTGKLTQSISSIFTKSKLDAATLEELEEALISSDLGVRVAADVCARLKKDRYDKTISADEVRQVLADHVCKILKPLEKPLMIKLAHKPHVILVVGVNGVGKTTTIAKFARQFKDSGHSVLLAAGDTFRAAAVEQLSVWGARLGAEVMTTKVGGDAAGLAFAAIEKARADGIDVVLVDTAGRLQNKSDLMDELSKIRRVIGKIDPTAPHDCVLVLDATTGQNALNQIEVFRDIAGITGIVMTKLDGTARGGILVAAADKYAVPIHAIGIGEQSDDLRVFVAEDFARALAGIG